ncbi:kinesin-like protein KIF23 [Lutzomyia longipalpis]|uniref:kinesin-like protein KIF23 n=1 Tax=Lutzomyia longipalpis TaxID=7200 RepID=UPI0024836F62|nr:kinesin-like protein KIF23 [Lutzomyia longipalpis]
MLKSTRMKTPAKTPKSKSRPNSDGSNGARDPVNVYCRIRPMQCESDLSCLKVTSSTTVLLTPPEIAINYRVGTLKETQHTFKHVFDVTSQQREVFSVVAQPLVESLIRGKNGLLFTYGVTGSGKTYTMTGDTQNQGIMPRCLDVLFRTISDYQTKKFVFKPDRLNGFEILSEADAMIERQAEMNAKFNKIRRNNSDPEIASRASTEVSGLVGLDEDNMYAVFVTYVEVYNNSVYDLLEEGSIQKTLQSKIIREDATHNMFVHGVTEVEVKSMEDAIEMFQLGQKRKRMGHTILNAESSRSHSVFTVRLVQAPTDRDGEYVMQDRRTITVSQLSLVDLAGSERTSRTKNTGQRLREAGNINNSLMTLRTCLEILRENQSGGIPKKVPYRDSKLTHLFKNYFDGEGQVKMIVCINPRAEDYDETAQVMRFAEMTQDVQITRPVPKLDLAGLTPGRRKANQLFKMAQHNLELNGDVNARNMDVDLGLVYSLGPNLPRIQLNSPDADELVQNLKIMLEQRIAKRNLLLADLTARQNNFRMHLLQAEKQSLMLKTENASVGAVLGQERNRSNALENKLVSYEASIDDLNRKVRDRDERIYELERKLSGLQNQLSQKEHEKEKQRKKFTSKFQAEKEEMSKELEMKLRAQKDKMQNEMRLKDEKLRLVTDIINSDKFSQRVHQPQQVVESIAIPSSTPSTATIGHTARTPRGTVVANVRHRRSKSAGDKWLAHTSATPVPLGTILQPYLPNRKTTTKLTEMRDVTKSNTSKYCLISQGADTDGELETRLFKGNIIPTMSGGAQVVLNDVECLKQMDPVSPTNRKRLSSEMHGELSPPEIKARCSTGIEGHNSHKKARL